MESLRKTLNILEVFLTNGGAVSLSEIAEATQLNIGTIHGIVSYLRERGYLIQTEKRGKYSLGYKFLDYGDMIMINNPINEIALPFMKKLNQLTRETVNLAIIFKNTSVVIGRVESSHDLRVVGKSEREAQLYCTGLGKVLLAYKSEEYWERYSSKVSFKPYTSYTITKYDQLKKELINIRNNGYGIDNQETGLGIINIAAPIRDSNEEVVASTGILGPTVRINESNLQELIKAVKKCASEISSALGSKN